MTESEPRDDDDATRCFVVSSPEREPYYWDVREQLRLYIELRRGSWDYFIEEQKEFDMFEQKELRRRRLALINLNDDAFFLVPSKHLRISIKVNSILFRKFGLEAIDMNVHDQLFTLTGVKRNQYRVDSSNTKLTKDEYIPETTVYPDKMKWCSIRNKHIPCTAVFPSYMWCYPPLDHELEKTIKCTSLCEICNRLYDFLDEDEL